VEAAVRFLPRIATPDQRVGSALAVSMMWHAVVAQEGLS
jgi:hypothetical protein